MGSIVLSMITITGANAQTDQERINENVVSCIQDWTKYNFVEETPGQIRRYCVIDAYASVFIDHCMALDTSWLKLGTHARCVALAKKQLGY